MCLLGNLGKDVGGDRGGGCCYTRFYSEELLDWKTYEGRPNGWMEERGNRRRREGGDPGLKPVLWWGGWLSGCAWQHFVGMGPGSGNRGVVE